MKKIDLEKLATDVAVLKARVDTLHDWAAKLQKDKQNVISDWLDMYGNLNTEKQVEDEADVIEQAMTNVARKAEIEDQWLNVLAVSDCFDTYELSASHEEVAKRLNNIIFKKIKPLIDENIRLKEQNENLDIAYMAGLSDGKNNQSVKTTNIISVPFEIDKNGDIALLDNFYTVFGYCEVNNIDQTRIKRILLEMKSEDE